MVPISVLDNAPVTAGSTHVAALQQTVDMARRAEALGYHRFWVGEHHRSTKFASMAPAVMLAHLAGMTQQIRLGSGGVMLHNHAPWVVAEQFRTLAALCPQRVDLGVGRTGCTPDGTAAQEATASDLDPFSRVGSFETALHMLQYNLNEMADSSQHDEIAATAGFEPLPIWVLAGGGIEAVAFAALNGLPMAIRPTTRLEDMLPQLRTYRDWFRSSALRQEPRVMVNVDCVAAETDDEAHYQASSLIQQVRNNLQKRGGALPPPVAQLDPPATPEQAAVVADKMAITLVGGPESLRRQINELIEATGADELMFSVWAHEPEARLRGLAVLAEAGGLDRRV